MAGRKSNEQRALEAKQSVRDRVEATAYDAAPAAMLTLAQAAGFVLPGTAPGQPAPKPSREQIQAAMYILNQVVGKPVAKPEADEHTDKVQDLLLAIRSHRAARTDVRAGRGRDADVVEPAAALGDDSGSVPPDA